MGKTAGTLDQKISYEHVDDKDILFFINAVNEGIKFGYFKNIADKSPFSLNEWSNFLHLSQRTMQRYKKEKRTFDPLQSEKILQIALLFNKGVDVFGNKRAFNSWLEMENVALGKMKPKDLLDNAFGIDLIKDELARIEYGILA